MDDTVLRAVGLGKQYGDFTAVAGLDLTLRRGEVFGLLGPNGAGKTTTILMLLGLTEPSAGTVQVLGLDPRWQPLQIKARVGYLPDQIGFYDELSAWANLAYTAQLNGIRGAEASRRIGAALERMGLAQVRDKRVAAFSRGMRQRLGLAEILLKEPELVIMDEPTLGLDPEAAREFLALIHRLKGEGITVLLSSHLLHQVQAICDRVGLFSRGRMVLEGSVDALAREVLGGAYRIRVEAEGPDTLAASLRRLPYVVELRRPEPHTFIVEATEDVRAEVAQAVVATGARLLGLSSEQPSLEEIYSSYFREEGRHARAA